MAGRPPAPWWDGGARPGLEAISKPRQAPEGDEGAGEVEEGAEVLELPLVAHHQAAEVEEPGVGALDDPAAAVAAQLSAILKAVGAGAEVRGDEVDAPRLHGFPEVAGVVAAVRDDAFGESLSHSLFERGKRERAFRGGRS
jgi:hypothetical protein